MADSEIEADLIQHAKRKPTPLELAATIANARATAGKNQEHHHGLTPEQRQRLKERRNLERERGSVAAARAVHRLTPRNMTFEELTAQSPVPLSMFMLEDHPEQAAALLLRTLYNPGERIFCGDTYGKRECIQTAERHADSFLNGATVPPLFIVNPLTGEEGETKSGKPSFRADACISAHRFALYECDLPAVPLEVQAGFLAGRIKAGWPVASIVYSGGKSLHALLKVDCTDPEAWTRDVRGDLFPVLEKLGADKACRNPSRLSRLPGHHRDNGKRQELLWLDTPQNLKEKS